MEQFANPSHALILYISTWKFDFGPETLPGLSTNVPWVFNQQFFQNWHTLRMIRGGMPSIDNLAKTFNVMSKTYINADSTLRDLCWYLPKQWERALGKFV